MAKKIDIFEIYPNSPLIEVVCEIRFHRELSIECQRNKFYEKVKKNYPNILLSKTKIDSVQSLLPYHFQKLDKSANMMISIDRFSYHENKYQGHKKFMNEFLRLVEILKKTYKLDRINRLGWRYVNVIPFVRKDAIIPLDQFLSIGLKVPKGVSDKFENFSFVFISKVNGGSVTTKIETVYRQEIQEEGILLDFDFAMTKGLNMSNLKKKIKDAHLQNRSLFENIITEKYRQYLRGNII